jgi:hypothetical protein
MWHANCNYPFMHWVIDVLEKDLVKVTLVPIKENKWAQVILAFIDPQAIHGT